MELGDPRLVRTREQVRAVLVEGPASRTQITAATGLAPGTVARAVRSLIDDGEAHELPAAGQGRGRPATLVALESLRGFVLGLEIGLARVTAGLADASGALVGERTVSLDGAPDGERAGAAAARLVADLLETHGVPREQVLSTVVCIPAPVDPKTGTVHDAPIVVEPWRGTHPAQMLEGWLGLPVTVMNDANAAALAERSAGAARGVQDLVYLHATVGVGAGLVLGDSLHTGADGGAGEIGHIRLHEASDLCRCGQRGCLESEASAAALVRKMAAVGFDLTDGQTVDELIRDTVGDAVVARLLGQAGSALGSVLADMCNALSPTMVVIGGELAAGGTALVAGVQESMRRYALSTVSRRVRIELAALGSRAGMIGAVESAAAQVRRLGR